MLIIELIVGWLVPGSCYFFKRDWKRGLVLFALLNVTFLIGLMLHGGVLWPVWAPRTEGFNLINILTYLTQMGSGLWGMLSTVADWGYLQMAPISVGESGFWSFLHGNELASTFELGSFYLLVAGAMNYFTLVGYYDRYYGEKKEEEAPSSDKS
jgi:hypothetical protein